MVCRPVHTNVGYTVQPKNTVKTKMGLFDDVELTDSEDFAPFISFAEGTTKVVITHVPEETKEIENIKYGPKDRLFITLIHGDGERGTWSVPYKKQTGTKSVLGQLIAITKEHKLKTLEGAVLTVTRLGEGRSTRYRIEYEKTLNSKQLSKIKEMADIKSKELEKASEAKSTTILDSIE